MNCCLFQALHDKITRRTTAKKIYLIDQFFIGNGIAIKEIGGGWMLVVMRPIGRRRRRGRSRRRGSHGTAGRRLTFHVHAGITLVVSIIIGGRIFHNDRSSIRSGSSPTPLGIPLVRFCGACRRRGSQRMAGRGGCRKFHAVISHDCESRHTRRLFFGS